MEYRMKNTIILSNIKVNEFIYIHDQFSTVTQGSASQLQAFLENFMKKKEEKNIKDSSASSHYRQDFSRKTSHLTRDKKSAFLLLENKKSPSFAFAAQDENVKVDGRELFFEAYVQSQKKEIKLITWTNAEGKLTKRERKNANGAVDV